MEQALLIECRLCGTLCNTLLDYYAHFAQELPKLLTLATGDKVYGIGFPAGSLNDPVVVEQDSSQDCSTGSGHCRFAESIVNAISARRREAATSTAPRDLVGQRERHLEHVSEIPRVVQIQSTAQRTSAREIHTHVRDRQGTIRDG